MANLEVYKGKGDDIDNKLGEGKEIVKKMGDEFADVKDHLSNMPDGLDSDIAALFPEIEEEGRRDAMRDIEDTKRTVIDNAKKEADDVKSDVTKKIGDNASAKSKLEGISSDYGKDGVNKAMAALDRNTEEGNELIDKLNENVKKAEDAIEKIIDNL